MHNFLRHTRRDELSIFTGVYFWAGPLSFSMVGLLRAGWFRTAVFLSAHLSATIYCAQDLAPRTYECFCCLAILLVGQTLIAQST